MAETDKITVRIESHGEYQTTVEALDKMMVRYLPAGVTGLRKHIREATGEGCEGHTSTDGAVGDVEYCDGSCVTAFNDLHTKTECLMILAELNGYGTN